VPTGDDDAVVATIDMPGAVPCAVKARLAREADGTMYVSTGAPTVPGGFIFRVAPGDGGTVLLLQWSDEIVGVASGPDGSVYFSTTTSVERFRPDGRITRLAAAEAQNHGSDGVATEIALAQPGTLAVDADGSVLFLEGGLSPGFTLMPRVRRVTSSGVMLTIGRRHARRPGAGRWSGCWQSARLRAHGRAGRRARRRSACRRMTHRDGFGP
jgi:hypothetical protein